MERGTAHAAEHGVERSVGSYVELVTNPEVDVVYDLLADGLHGPWNVAAMEASKHVLPAYGRTAAAAMLPDAEIWARVRWFWSDQHDLLL